MPTKTSKKKKPAKTKKAVSRKPAPKKKAAKKAAPVRKPAPAKKAAPSKKTAPKKKKALKKNRVRGKSDSVDTVVFEPKGLGARSGGQSGDLQGLSNRAGADSESVDELLEEGNAFEAEVVKGVEDVPDADAGEIRTHEVPEDDVPDEYLEKDK
jgi:outer membrane biosynthesis protein TonB